MKAYRDAPQALIKMTHDPELIAKLDAAVADYGIDTAIETGTFDGTGSTRMVAECLLRTGRPKLYVTIEVGFRNWTNARRNLREFPFVDCRWGCSVEREKAVAFVQQDEALVDHERYPDVYIDDVDDPVSFYSNELRGTLAWQQSYLNGASDSLPSLIDKALTKVHLLPPIENKVRDYLWSGEGLLPKYLDLHRDNRPLIILDSAGGCGWYEFQVMLDVMKDAPYLLLLDDTHHLKHFRSLERVKSDPRFRLIGHSPYHGWALAWHGSP